MKPKPPTLLLTLDAFGTLFVPREPIAKQYSDVARRYGLKGVSDKEVGLSFRRGKLSNIGLAGGKCASTALLATTLIPLSNSFQVRVGKASKLW